MLVAQAYYASELFLNKKIEKNKISECYKKILLSKRNICLVGMPGSGKSTMGKILAETLNRSLYDIDIMIEEKEGISISEIFEKFGEEYFRKAETEILREISKESGAIIASGGGSILKEVNRDLIRQNSFVIFLDRPLEKLERVGRPLSKEPKSLEKLFSERYLIYKEISDLRVSVVENKEECLKKILEGLKID